jgi:hypothetical protein
MLVGDITSKQVTLLLVAAILLCIESLPSVFSQTSDNAPISAPAIERQTDYGRAGVYDGTGVQSASNLIQTSDGGYAFMDLGWGYQFTFEPSTFFKVDSLGNVQFEKTIDFLAASSIIQTNDEGYEIAGYWSTYGTTYEHTPTLVKMDYQGNIQWAANFSSVPDLGIASTGIETSDGGFAYWKDGSITKNDSNNNTQWVKNLTYTGADGTAPLELSSVIETSDGALATLGVGYNLFDNPRTGKIYLIKTEAFLPIPSQALLPTPIPTPTPTPEPISTALVIAIVILVAIGTIALIVVICTGLLVYYRKSRRGKPQ